MGAVQSDLKANIVQASSAGRVIDKKDDDYWQIYWSRPETAEHVFETFTATDIRGMRDDTVTADNLKTLVLRTTLQLLKIKITSKSLSDENAGSGLTILNCIRVLTRILPFIYENETSRRWEESVFSVPPDMEFYKGYVVDPETYLSSDKSLTAQLVDTLLELLFYTGFTLTWPESNATGQREGVVSYGLWQSGIACDTTVLTSKELESRRTEVLRLLLTLESKSIYVGPSEYIAYDVQALQCIVRHTDKRRVQSLLCSLLNTILKYHPDSWLPFDPRKPQDSIRETHVTVCLHFLLITLLNRAPWDENGKDRNEFRLQFGYLHRPKHFQFLADGIFKILRRPLETPSSMLSLPHKAVSWTSEMIILSWEGLLSNRKYLHYVVESGRALDLMVLLIYYAKESHMEGIARVCIFCLQTLSAETHFGALLNRSFEAHNTLPSSIQIKNFHGRYSDYFVTSLLSLLDNITVDATFLTVSLTAIISNIAPHVIGLGRATSSKLVQTFAKLAQPSVLISNESNMAPLMNILQAINSIIEAHITNHENPDLLYATWRARAHFEGLRRLSLMDEEEIASLDIRSSSRPPSIDYSGPNEESEKSRGKRPIDQKPSSVEFMHKLANLPLHTPVTLINFLRAGQSSCPNQDTAENPGSPDGEALMRSPTIDSRLDISESNPSLPSMATVLKPLNDINNAYIPGLHNSFMPNRKPESQPFRFAPSIAALYASYYWSLVVVHDAAQRGVAGSGAAGIWAGTEVRLFRIKAGEKAHGPSLMSPKGAVDAVGESLVAGVWGLTERARKGISGE